MLFLNDRNVIQFWLFLLLLNIVNGRNIKTSILAVLATLSLNEFIFLILFCTEVERFLERGDNF